ncbi:MAG: hypothetical protein ABW133_19765 [Polyangiaceae bacterium]
MSRHIAAARESMVPNWDAARERRVFEHAARVRWQRSRVVRAVAWSSAAATVVVLLRFAPLGLGTFSGTPSSATGSGQPGKADPALTPPPSFTDGGGHPAATGTGDV